MAQIKAAEVSAILKKQLANFDASVSLEEVGTVLEVGDGIARIFRTRLGARERCAAPSGSRRHGAALLRAASGI